MSKYYYLIAGLPDVTLDDSKLSYTVADFKTGIYPDLSAQDKGLVDLFYLKFDNENVLRLLKDKEAETDERGCFTAAELSEAIEQIREGGQPEVKHFPAYLATFISQYLQADFDEGILPENRLAALYYAHTMKSSNPFVASWFAFNLHLNNILIALTARKYKWEVAGSLVGDTEVGEALRTSGARDFGLSGEVEYFDALLKIHETEELLEREKKLDQLRWDWLEEATFFHYFTIERIFAFLVRLEMIERWVSLDKEKGNQLFRRMIGDLKNEVRIPAEFK